MVKNHSNQTPFSSLRTSSFLQLCFPLQRPFHYPVATLLPPHNHPLPIDVNITNAPPPKTGSHSRASLTFTTTTIHQAGVGGASSKSPIFHNHALSILLLSLCPTAFEPPQTADVIVLFSTVTRCATSVSPHSNHFLRFLLLYHDTSRKPRPSFLIRPLSTHLLMFLPINVNLSPLFSSLPKEFLSHTLSSFNHIL